LSGWGVKFLDFDNDGDLDLLIANGHPDDRVEEHYVQVKYKEPLLLFHNTGVRGRRIFDNVSAQAGPPFQQQFAARGLAIGDYDNDGGIDVLVAVNNDAPLLLHNVACKSTHWLGVKLVGRKANRDGVGAKVTWRAGDLKRHRFKSGGGSYLASHDPRMILGIGQRTKIDWIEVKWPQPSGLVERFANLPVDRYLTLEEGKGSKVS
jgi:enediyne biosynthesis protein E4